MKTLYELLNETDLRIEQIVEKCSTCNKAIAFNSYVKSYLNCNCAESQPEILYAIEGFDKLMSYNEAVRNLEYFIKVSTG